MAVGQFLRDTIGLIKTFLGEAYKAGVQRGPAPLPGGFYGDGVPLNGRGGIRTPVTIAGESVFETDAFGHSATLPGWSGLMMPGRHLQFNEI